MTRRLPDSLRAELARPWGDVVDDAGLAAAIGSDDVVLAVGDVVSMTLQRLGITPKLFVCDYQTQRGGPSPEYEAALGSWGDVEIRVANPAATLTDDAWQAIRDALAAPQAPVRIVVDGEEDLLGIPCFLEAPEGAIVIYGMPGQGAVVCRVTPELRGQVQALVDQMA